MSILRFLRLQKKTTAAETAKERLQIVLAHERSDRSAPDFLPKMHKDLVAVIAKYVEIEEDHVEVKLERGVGVSTLEINIELPNGLKARQEQKANEPEAPKGKDGGKKDRKEPGAHPARA